jgi:hypothetical protein
MGRPKRRARPVPPKGYRGIFYFGSWPDQLQASRDNAARGAPDPYDEALRRYKQKMSSRSAVKPGRVRAEDEKSKAIAKKVEAEIERDYGVKIKFWNWLRRPPKQRS